MRCLGHILISHLLLLSLYRLSTEVLSLVPSVNEVTSLFYEPDYPSDFSKSLPPLAEIDNTTSSSTKKLSGGTKGIFLNLTEQNSQSEFI